MSDLQERVEHLIGCLNIGDSALDAPAIATLNTLVADIAELERERLGAKVAFNRRAERLQALEKTVDRARQVMQYVIDARGSGKPFRIKRLYDFIKLTEKGNYGD